MKIRFPDIDSHVDPQLQRIKGSRGNKLPWIKYRNRADKMDEYKMKQEDDGGNALILYWDLLHHSTGCPERGTLADSSGKGWSLEFMAVETKHPVDRLKVALPLLIRYGWIEDLDQEMKPSMATAKVFTMRKAQARMETPWTPIAARLIEIWQENALSKAVQDPVVVEKALSDMYQERYELGELIIQNALKAEYSHAKYWPVMTRWIAEGFGTAPRKLKVVALDAPINAEAWERDMREQYAAGKITQEDMEAIGLKL